MKGWGQLRSVIMSPQFPASLSPILLFPTAPTYRLLVGALDFRWLPSMHVAPVLEVATSFTFARRE